MPTMPNCEVGQWAVHHCQQRSEYILSHCGRIASGDVHHGDVVLCAPWQVDVVGAYRGCCHEFASRACKQCGVAACACAHYYGIGIGYGFGIDGSGGEVFHRGISVEESAEERDVFLHHYFQIRIWHRKSVVYARQMAAMAIQLRSARWVAK